MPAGPVAATSAAYTSRCEPGRRWWGSSGSPVVRDRSTKCVAFEGRILIIGFTGGRFAEARTNHVLIKNYSVVGVHWGLYNVMNPQVVQQTHEELLRLFDAGRIDPLISETVTLAQVPAALVRLGSRATYGKLVCEL